MQVGKVLGLGLLYAKVVRIWQVAPRVGEGGKSISGWFWGVVADKTPGKAGYLVGFKSLSRKLQVIGGEGGREKNLGKSEVKENLGKDFVVGKWFWGSEVGGV